MIQSSSSEDRSSSSEDRSYVCGNFFLDAVVDLVMVSAVDSFCSSWSWRCSMSLLVRSILFWIYSSNHLGEKDRGSWRTEIWKITVIPAGTICTCPFFMKNGQCKHELGTKIRRTEDSVPQEAKTIPHGQKRKRGRPTKAKKALIVQ